MAKLINAPHLADQPHEPYSDIFILAGRKAWQAWDNGKGEEWLLLCSLIHGLDRNIKPVILDTNIYLTVLVGMLYGITYKV